MSEISLEPLAKAINWCHQCIIHCIVFLLSTLLISFANKLQIDYHILFLPAL